MAGKLDAPGPLPDREEDVDGNPREEVPHVEQKPSLVTDDPTLRDRWRTFTGQAMAYNFRLPQWYAGLALGLVAFGLARVDGVTRIAAALIGAVAMIFVLVILAPTRRNH
jgi:hypothetical protein